MRSRWIITTEGKRDLEVDGEVVVFSDYAHALLVCDLLKVFLGGVYLMVVSLGSAEKRGEL